MTDGPPPPLWRVDDELILAFLARHPALVDVVIVWMREIAADPFRDADPISAHPDLRRALWRRRHSEEPRLTVYFTIATDEGRVIWLDRIEYDDRRFD